MIDSKLGGRTGVSPRKYPYLGITKDERVVLFTSAGTGTELRPHHRAGCTGDYATRWCEGKFTYMTQPIELKNEVQND